MNPLTGEGNGRQFFKILSEERFQGLQDQLNFEWPEIRDEDPYYKAYDMAHRLQWCLGGVCLPCELPENHVDWWVRKYESLTMS